MKKRFGLYTAAWAVLLALFNVIAFVVPSLPTTAKYTASFWIGYVLITVMFIGQLICSLVAIKVDSAKKIFYRIPLIRSTYAGLICSFIFGGLCMLLSPLPYWVGVVLCAIVLAANVISVVKAAGAIELIEQVDENVKENTLFIKVLTAEFDTLTTIAKSEAVKAECKKVYEAARYSDPMSNDALTSIEEQITAKYVDISLAVGADDAEKVAGLVNELLILIGDRNTKCKLLK